MKKFIILLCISIIVISGTLAGSYYLDNKKIQSQEQHTFDFMQTKFNKLVESWNPALISTLYIENAEVYNIALVLAEIKEDIGVCKMKTVSACESQSRHKKTKKDAYYTTGGYSVRCPFVITCEKEDQATGEAIFIPDGHIGKLFSFKLTYGE